MVTPLKDIRLLLIKYSPLESGDQMVQEFEDAFMQLRETYSQCSRL